MQKEIRFGPAGIGGFKEIQKNLGKFNELGIRCAEIPFTYQVWLTNSQSEAVAEIAKKFNIQLSIHAPYYINLNSQNNEKIEASIRRILLCCERAHFLQAKYIVFHAAFYGNKTLKEVYDIVKSKIIEMQKIIKEKGWHVHLALETTGKKSQFGSLDELLQLVKETKCSLCIDFAHLHARDGKIDYNEIFRKIKSAGLNHLHCHFSGIEFGSKGEIRHLVTPESDLRKLLIFMKKYGVDANLINESPAPIEDSIKGIRILKNLK